jgi:DNA-binding response OmpR family regulator
VRRTHRVRRGRLSEGLLACVFLANNLRRVLIVEDQLLIALSVATLLEDAGYEPVGPASQVTTAIVIALKEPLDAALLDVDLEGQSSQPVAEILTRRRIPFAVVTSYERARLPTVMSGSPYIRKPFTDDEIKAVVARMCAN